MSLGALKHTGAFAAALTLPACSIVGGEDVIDQRTDRVLFAEWNSNGTHFFTKCRSKRTEWRKVDAPLQSALISVSTKAPMTDRNYRNADFYVCPELAEVSQ